MPLPFVSAAPKPWRGEPAHSRWLQGQADALLDMFAHAIHPKGGFCEFDREGRPAIDGNPVRPIHLTARMVHCHAIGSLMGRPGSDAIVDRGMEYLWAAYRDGTNGGYVWSVDNDGPVDSSKQGYGHAFVLLAASSAKTVGHPLADRMIADVTEILQTRFWEESHGAIAEEFDTGWNTFSAYRGQNSNMHLTEALMAAYEVTGDATYIDMAGRIADLFINHHARSVGFRVPEHFDAPWKIDKGYRAEDEMFRPSGTTPGHWLEWSRLILQLWSLTGKRDVWMPDAARELFRQSIDLGWDSARGGFFYTLDWNDRPAMRHKLWWPMCEGVGAASFLLDHDPTAYHEEWYRRIWSVIARRHLDTVHGGWHEELTEDMRPSYALFPGKGDIYHALQACLIPLYRGEGSLTKMIGGGS